MSEPLRIDLAAFLAALAEAGFPTHQIGPATWIAPCPVCHDAGHFSLMEIRSLPDGVTVVEHGRARAASAARAGR